MKEIILICLYGPESTGKSEMAKRLAEIYKTEIVPEVYREILNSNSFNSEDIIEIGKAQTARVFQKMEIANKVLFCDTDVITTQIYSRHYLKVVPPELYQLEEMISYHHYFLFDVDVPWIADGLRDLGEERKELFEIFKAELEKRNISYTLVHGDWQTRARIVNDKIDALIKC